MALNGSHASYLCRRHKASLVYHLSITTDENDKVKMTWE